MKSTRFILQIEKPCHTNLSAMERNDVGLFCTSCEKHVIDFSKLSDEEVISIVEKTDGKICGRFTKSQLDRVFTASQKRQSSPRLNKILAGLFAFGMLESAHVEAKETKNAEMVWSDVKQQNNIPENDFEKNKISGDTAKNIISGIVLEDVTKKPVTNGFVILYGTSYTAPIDSGKFSLIIPDSLVRDSISIVICATGYSSRKMTLHKTEFPATKTILVHEEMMIEGGVGIMEQPSPADSKKKKKH
jgi:hypothetical protein